MADERNAAQAKPGKVNIRWDDTGMRSLYANVCNVTGTREEMVLLFGVNQTWQTGAKELVIQLLDRVVLSPYAAKRLNLLLTRVLEKYEEQYGTLAIESAESQPAQPLAGS
jgi:Protein of unknown function (DUF3467)